MAELRAVRTMSAAFEKTDVADIALRKLRSPKTGAKGRRGGGLLRQGAHLPFPVAGRGCPIAG